MALQFVKKESSNGGRTGSTRDSIGGGAQGQGAASSSSCRSTVPRFATGSSSSGAGSANTESWLVKHRPAGLKEVSLAVHSAYRSKVREWLGRACKAHTEHLADARFRPHILALCGPSGCGKSTLVEVLCRDAGIDVVDWTDDMWDVSPALSLAQEREFAGAGDSLFAGRGSAGSGGGWGRQGGGYPHAGHGNRDFRAERQSRAEELECFVRQSAYPKLALVGHQYDEAGAGADPWGATSSSRGPAISTAHASEVPIGEASAPAWRRVVVMHDPPHLVEGQARLQQQLGELLAGFRDPVVLILSGVGGRDDVHYAASRCIPRSIQSQVHLESIYQAGCTNTNVVKTLKGIADRERVRAPTELLEGIADSSSGDLRHAIVQLQLAVLSSSQRGGGGGAGSAGGGFDLHLDKSSLCLKISAEEEGEEEEDLGKRKRSKKGKGKSNLVMFEDSEGLESGAARGGRMERMDARYSSLHSCAKIINACLNESGRLDFDCDQVVYKSEIEPELLIPFVQVRASARRLGLGYVPRRVARKSAM